MLTLNDGRSELWQWDTGRKLTVDADCSQVHFSNKVFGRSIDVDVVDGAAIIPDVLLQTDKDLNAWAFVGTAENGYTKISKTFKVNRRNKPADYVFTPTDQTTLSKLEERLDRIEESQDPDAIKNAVEDYLAQNPVEVPVKSVNGQTGAVELTAEDVGAIAVETDPTVPEWAKAPEKPSYTAAEVGALPVGTEIPDIDPTLTKSGKAADAKAVGDELAKKQAAGNYLTEIPNDYAKKTDIPSVPTKVSAFENDKGYLTEQDLSGYAKSKDIPTKPSDIGAQPAGNYATKDEIPTTLPNPHKLTFSGAVSAEYDGSEAVEVAIPQGGGGSSGGEKLELIYEGTLEESVTSWEISRDNDGNPFALSEAVFVLTSVITDDDNIYQNIGTYVNGNAVANNAQIGGFNTKSPRYYYCRIKMYPGIGPEVFQFVFGQNYNWVPTIGKMGYKHNDLWKYESITSLTIVGATGKSIGLAGTSVIVCGVRA